MDILDMIDGISYGIKKSRTARDRVVFQRHLFHIVDADPVMENLGFVIEQDGGDKGLAPCLPLLFEYGVEAPNCVGLIAVHGTAAIQNEHQFSQAISHSFLLGSIGNFLVRENGTQEVA